MVLFVAGDDPLIAIGVARNGGVHRRQIEAGSFSGAGLNVHVPPSSIGGIFRGYTIAVGEKHFSTHPTRGPLWGDSFNLYSKGAVYPYTAIDPNMVWQLSTDFDACSGKVNSNYCKYGWSAAHGAGNMNFLFGDGSVKSIPKTIDLNILAALSTIAGGEVIPNY